MKICIINFEFTPIGGGAGRVTHEVIKRLADRADFDLITSYYYQEKIFPQKVDGINIYPVRSYRNSIHEAGFKGLISFLFFASFKFSQLLHKNKYDLIHYYFSIPTGLLSFLQPRKIPYIISLNGGDVPLYNPEEFKILHKIIKPLNKLIVKRASAVTAVSQDLGEKAKRILEIKNFIVIPNGVSIKNFNFKKKRRSGRYKIICVSRLTYWKRIDVLLKAIADIENVELQIIGDGCKKTELQSLVKSLGITNKVNFLGYIPNEKVKDYLEAADVFVLPSVGDSFGIVFLEAMASGVPVIAACAGGVPEIIKHEYNGLLIKPDNVYALKASILRLMHDNKLAEKFINNSFSLLRQKYNWDIISERYFDLYKMILKNNY